MDTNTNHVISVSKLVKKFGDFTALDHLDLTVKKGEVHGFLGPNGAGKSTAIRVLLGILRKTSGDVKLLGKDPWNDAVELHKHLAYVPGEVNLWPNLSGGEAIDVIGALRGGLEPRRRADLIRRFKLDPSKKFRTYSKGNRQKVGIVAALASDVELYILDEPTSGLDPLMEAVFQDYIKGMKAEGKTILLSSHILAEVEALCDQITIIREGRAVESGTLSELQHLHRSTMVVETEKSLDSIRRLKGVHNLKKTAGRTKFEIEPESLNQVLQLLAKADVKSFVSQPPRLEELFLRHYNDKPKKDA